MKDQIILDLANNHQGDVKHAKQIIDELSLICDFNHFNIYLKFQFRNLKTFIHSSAKTESNKHIKRFLETELSWDEYSELINYSKSKNFLIMITCFDENSIEHALKNNLDCFKVASCSADDWPLIERISKTNLPMVISTGGLNIEQVDDIVSFSQHRALDFSLMHCVGVYPSNRDILNLLRIKEFKSRYPEVNIGWSTHENPEDTMPVVIAKSLGSSLFERHVGLNKNNYKLNNYSSTPAQIEKWLNSLKESEIIMGKGHSKPIKEELESLKTLKRGIYAKNSIKNNNLLTKSDIEFCFPKLEGQIEPKDFNDNLTINTNLKKGSPILKDDIKDCKIIKSSKLKILKKAVHEAKAILNYSKISLGSNFSVEFSFHYGIETFRKNGAILVDVVNREYCKKLIVMLHGQSHPLHHHKRKEETFQLLYGDLNVSIDNFNYELNVGDTLLVLPGSWHSFSSQNGAVFEEISTTHYVNDSVYKDSKINSLEYSERKMKVKNWGRYELFDLIEKK